MDESGTAGTDALSEVERVALDIRTMRIRGAGRIARAASEALSLMADGWKGRSKAALMNELRRGADLLLSTRPTAVSLKNGVELTLSGIDSAPDVEAIKKLVKERSARFVSSSLEAVSRIAENGKALVPEGSTVMTHCNSDAALTLIEAAFDEGRVKGVIATESRPWRQGHLTVRRLARKRVPVTMIVDSAVRHLMGEVDAVVVGADTVSADGSVTNKIGTSQMALAAHESRRPFIICAETYKFSREALTGAQVAIEDRGPDEVADPSRPSDFPGVSFRNPVFDTTPPDYINAIVTEIGVITPGEASRLIRTIFGDAPMARTSIDSERSERPLRSDPRNRRDA